MNTLQSAPVQLNDHELAKQAMTLMDAHKVRPTPENYAVWFAYSEGKNKELAAEIDNIDANKLPFTLDTSKYLYNKYIVGNRNQKVLDDASLAAQKLLQDVLRVVTDFSGEQKNYNKDVDQYIEKISVDFEDDNIKNTLKELVTATTTLRQSGEKITEKLEESKKEITVLRKNLQQVTIEAQRDFLTGVFNRKTFEKMYDELSMVAKEKQTELCLIMIDIDFFKKFNDKYGHLLGDEVLKTVARTLTEVLKGRDVVARFGGEEFVVILPETPIEGAMKVADMIRATIASKELKRKDTGETFGTITVSMGVAKFRHTSDTLPTLMKRADDALYQSKHKGRNCVTRSSAD
ncbi:MAG: GGDEF domain-containing protein [Alphaproteobacteria bacterium]